MPEDELVDPYRLHLNRLISYSPPDSRFPEPGLLELSAVLQSIQRKKAISRVSQSIFVITSAIRKDCRLICSVLRYTVYITAINETVNEIRGIEFFN